MKRILLFVIVISIIICKASFCQAGIIINEGFETGVLDPWVNPDTFPDKWSVDTLRVHSGDFSAHAITPSNGGVYPLMQSFEPIAVDDILSFSYWFYIDSDLPVIHFGIGLWFSDGSYEQDINHDASQEEWHMRDVMPTIEQYSGRYLEKVGVFDTVASSVWMDDFCIETIPEPTTILFLGLGIIGISKIRSKSEHSG